MESKYLIKLSIPYSASKKGQLFLKFCLKHFGGKTKYFTQSELSQEEIKIFSMRFARLNYRFFREPENLLSNKVYATLQQSDLGEAYVDNKISLHLEIITEQKLTTSEDNHFAMIFLKKIRQLFDVLNYLQQWSEADARRWKDYHRRLADYHKNLADPPRINYAALFD